jgi:hypothetical protein
MKNTAHTNRKAHTSPQFDHLRRFQMHKITLATICTALLLGACQSTTLPSNTLNSTVPAGNSANTGSDQNNSTPAAPNTQTPAPTTSGIAVRGKLLKFNGEPIFGVTVQIDDANGNRQERPTDVSGVFTANDVSTPYNISVVPQNALTPTTWKAVTRTDPSIVLSTIDPTTFAIPDACDQRSGRLNVRLDQPVDSGNKGQVFFIAKGINHLELLSNARSNPILANTSSTNLNVPFDRALCPSEVKGTLVYLERDNSTGAIENLGTTNATLPSGETISKTITVRRAIERDLKFQTFVPQGISQVFMQSVLEVNGAGLILEEKQFPVDATSGSVERSFAVPELDGLQYRVMATSRSFNPISDSKTVRWAHSEALNLPLPLEAVVLKLPNLAQTRAPGGTITTTTPTFSANKVDETNLYLTLLQGINVNTKWFGVSPDKEITIPELLAPARVEAGTQFRPKTYQWFALNAVKVRGEAGSDAMLDGRLVGKVFFGPLAVFNPSVIAHGSFRRESAVFEVVTP